MLAQSRVIQLQTPSGRLRGSFQHSKEANCEYLAFKGIPYAKPPIGPLRFQDPEPFGTWDGVRDALNHGPNSVQYDTELKCVKGSEDCLYLNVYTRSVEAPTRAPVMFWIHGGAFVLGSGDDDTYGPDYLLRKEIVLVTINYRLGIFGFLNMEDELAPGNQGMKDIVLALEWVQTHIASFGGDPDNVTAFGSSAGAAAVHHMTMSPMAKGLFHKAICQSGCGLNPWAVKHEPRKALAQFLDILGCSEREPKAVLKFLKTQDAYCMIAAQQKLITGKHWIMLTFPFGPGVDNKSSKPFMPVHPYEAAEAGIQIPLLVGHNSLEGLLLLRFTEGIDMKELNRNLENYTSPVVIDLLKRFDMTVSELRNLYMNNQEVSERNMDKFLEYWSDTAFNEAVHRLIKIQFNNSAAPTYMYKLSFHKNLSLLRRVLNSPIKGVCHGDEPMYLFRARIYDIFRAQQLQPGTGADKVMKQMVELWTNFARTGRPTPSTSELVPIFWQPLASDVILRYLNIDEELSMEKMLNVEQRYSIKKNGHRIY